MKPLTELKDGQKVLVCYTAIEHDTDENIFYLNDHKGNFICKINKDLTTELLRYPIEAYDFNEVMQGAKEIDFEEFESVVRDKFTGNYLLTFEQVKQLYYLFKSYSPKSEAIIPKVGEVWEFSNDGKKWVKCKLYDFIGITESNQQFSYKFIRPVQKPSEEEKKAIELLESKGYKVSK